MNNDKLSDIVRDIVSEEWDKDVEVKSTGEHADKTIAQIKKEMDALKGKKPFNREQFSELMFALRAKQGWKKGKGATKESITMNKSNLKEIIRTELSDLLSENTNAIRQSFDIYERAVDELHMLAKFKLKTDRTFLKLANEFGKLLNKLENHLHNNYADWEQTNEQLNEDWRLELRSGFRSIEDANKYGLGNLIKNTRRDKELIKLSKASIVLTKKLEKHLHREYPDWEKRMDEDIKNSKKSKANLVNALKKFKKGAKVHYFPLSGGNYVMVGPDGVQTKDKEAVNVQIRKIGTYDADNPNQVSVGIELNNGHEATWNGKEFEIDDLGCPLILGKG